MRLISYKLLQIKGNKGSCESILVLRITTEDKVYFLENHCIVTYKNDKHMKYETVKTYTPWKKLNTVSSVFIVTDLFLTEGT